MPLDFSMYRGFQPPAPQQMPTPQEIEAAQNAIALQKQQQEINRQRMAQGDVTLRDLSLRADEYARQTREHQQVVDVLRKHGGDIERATPDIMQINPILGAQFGEQVQTRKQELQKQEQARVGRRNDELARGAVYLKGITDVDEKIAAQKVLHGQFAKSPNFTPQEIDSMDPTQVVDDNQLDYVINSSSTVAKEQREALDAEAKRKKEEAEALYKGAQTEGEKFKTQAAQQEFLNPTKKIKESKITADDYGGQTLVNVYTDGTKDEIPLKAKGKTKTQAAAAGEDLASDLTDEAQAKLAQMFATTGQLPAMGSGTRAAKMRTSIMNRAAKDFPTVDFATNKAAFQANQGSLRNLQKQQDALESFETTAGKNLDTFLSTAKNVVDTGSPWINSPLRTVAQKGFGSTDMAAYTAARQVAVTEIAKVLNNPNSSAAVGARNQEEIQKLIGPDATLKQIYEAAQILRTDMKNRRESGREQIKAITGRIGGKADESGDEQKDEVWVRDPKTGKLVKQ